MIWAATLLAMTVPACQVLTTGDVGKVVGAVVTVDPNQSGPAENGWDFCAWKTPDGHFVILGVGPKATYAATLVEAFGGGPAAQAIAGLGDEAQYRDYTGSGKGGVLVIRSGPLALTLEGPMSRDKVLALSRIVLARIGSH